MPYVLWPVGPGTGAVTYDWTDTQGAAFDLLLGIVAPGGQAFFEEAVAPAYEGWHSGGDPEGWHMLGASSASADAAGHSWTWTVTP